MAGEDFFSEGLRSTVERAVVLTEREVRCIVFGESGAVGARSGEDAAAGDVTPRHAGLFAGLRDEPWEHGVSLETLRLVQLAGVDVRLPRVACGIDHEGCAPLAQRVGEERRVRVVQFRAANVAERDAFTGEVLLEGLTNVAGTAEEEDHGDG